MGIEGRVCSYMSRVLVSFSCSIRFKMKGWVGLKLGFGFRLRVSITVKFRVTVTHEGG